MAAHPTDQLLSLVEQEAQKQGVDPATAKAILLSENSYFNDKGQLIKKSAVDTTTTSPKEAYGIMQVIPTTAANLRRMGYFSGDPNTPDGQIALGVAAIKEMQDRGITKPTEQAVAYNGGGGSLQAFRNGKTMNPETTDYLKKFTQHYTGTGGQMADSVPTAYSATPTPDAGTARESYSTSRRQIPPAILADIGTQRLEANALNAETLTQLKALTQDILKNSGAQQLAVDAAANAEISQTDAKSMERTAVNDNIQSILSTFNVGTNSPENIVAKRMELIRANSNERAMLATQIGALDSGASPLTDPVGWVMNQVKQYPMIQRHNALVAESTGAAKEIELAQGLAMNQEKLQPANVKDAINAQRVSDNNATLAKATVEKLKLQGMASAKVAQFVLETDASKRTNLAQNIDWANMNSTTVGESFSVTDKNKKAEDELLNPIHAVTDSWGLPRFNRLTFETLSKEDQRQWVKIGSYGRTGVTPGESVALLHSTYGNVGLARMDEKAPIASKFISGIVDQGQKELDSLMVSTNPGVQSQLKRLKTPMDQLAFGIDSWAKKKNEELKGNNNMKLPDDNPYKLNYFHVATTDALKGNPLSDFITKKPNDGIRIDDHLLLTTAAADVTTGKRSVGDVAQYVHEFYTKGMDQQRKDTAAVLTGWKPQEKYPVATKLFTFNSQPVDLFNKQSIEHFLVQQIASKKTSEMFNVVKPLMNMALPGSGGAAELFMRADESLKRKPQ